MDSRQYGLGEKDGGQEEEEEEEGHRATGKRIDFSLNGGMSLRGEEGRGLVGGTAPPVFSSGLLRLLRLGKVKSSRAGL